MIIEISQKLQGKMFRRLSGDDLRLQATSSPYTPKSKSQSIPICKV